MSSIPLIVAISWLLVLPTDYYYYHQLIQLPFFEYADIWESSEAHSESCQFHSRAALPVQEQTSFTLLPSNIFCQNVSPQTSGIIHPLSLVQVPVLRQRWEIKNGYNIRSYVKIQDSTCEQKRYYYCFAF